MTTTEKLDESEILPAIARQPAREDITGQPVTIDGETWLLADAGIAPSLTEVRDRIYDMSVIRGEVDLSDVMTCAFLMLTANYKIANEDAAALLWRADPDELTQAVSAALFGANNIRRTYTAWATSALLSNGIKPSSIPAAMLPHVLKQLVETKRAMPLEDFTEADEAAAKRSALLNFGKD